MKLGFGSLHWLAAGMIPPPAIDSRPTGDELGLHGRRHELDDIDGGAGQLEAERLAALPGATRAYGRTAQLALLSVMGQQHFQPDPA